MSTVLIGWGGSYVNWSAVRIGWGGSYVTPSKIYAGYGGSWVQVWSNYTPVGGSATGSTAIYNLGNASTPINRAMSTTATAKPTGGNGAYTYAWSIVGTSGIISSVAISGTSSEATVTIRATARLNNFSSVQLQCIVSDGTSSATLTTTVYFNYFNIDGT